MMPLEDRRSYATPDECPFGCQAEVSDAWVFSEAVMTLFVSLFTMAYLVLRRPRLALMLIVLVSVVGAMAGWW